MIQNSGSDKKAKLILLVMMKLLDSEAKKQLTEENHIWPILLLLLPLLL